MINVIQTKDCVLFDEKSNKKLNIPKSATDCPDFIFGLKQKRILDVSNFAERIKFVAIEGSSLTLLGLVKYDSEEDSFHMTQVSAILSSGLQQVRKVLSDDLEKHRYSYIKMGLIGVALLCSGFALYMFVK